MPRVSIEKPSWLSPVNDMDPGRFARSHAAVAPRPLAREAIAASLIALLGVGLRLAFVRAFPTQPITDFKYLVELGIDICRDGIAAPSRHWAFFNPGLPMVLGTLFCVLPGKPVVLARLATAAATGLMALLPFAIWRGALPFAVRCVTAGLLTFWFGQIAFSGVVAQDNWVLLPTVALASLGARAVLVPDAGYPITAALLYAAGMAFRQEMMVVLLPLVLAAAGLRWKPLRSRRGAILLVAVTVPLALLATHRYAATGRWALTSEHGGMAMLGAFVPGAAASGWIDPHPYVEDIDPSLVSDTARLRKEAYGIAFRLAVKRPVFHTARVLSLIGMLMVDGANANTAWSLYQPRVLAARYKPRLEAIAWPLAKLLHWESVAILSGFLATLLICGRRNAAVWIIVTAIALKVGIHAVTVMQGRYLQAVTGMMILVIGLGVHEAMQRSRREVLWRTLVAAFVAIVVAYVAPRLWAEVRSRDFYEPRFTLGLRSTRPLLRCTVRNGRVGSLVAKGFSGTVLPLLVDPRPGDVAVAECQVKRVLPAGLLLRVRDGYAPGGFPGRIEQRVEIGGRELLRHDLAAEAGSGWFEFPVDSLRPGDTVKVEVIAVHPDPGPAWGNAGATTIELGVSRR